MTRREIGIVAFALATLVLAVVVAFGRSSLRPAPDAHLPALNGPPPTATPAGPTGPSAAPSPAGSTPGRQAVGPTVAMGHLEAGEDEAEDEPAGAEAASSSTAGPSSAASGGSGGQSRLPGIPSVRVAAAPGLPPLIP